jgi:hypothetical protein
MDALKDDLKRYGKIEDEVPGADRDGEDDGA